MVHYRTTAVDGHQVFYREAGEPRRPTLLLLHGLPRLIAHVPRW